MTLINQVYGSLRWKKTDDLCASRLGISLQKYQEVKKQIGKEKTGDLKEALTVLLNTEFNDILEKKDEGYPDHQKLREYILYLLSY